MRAPTCGSHGLAHVLDWAVQRGAVHAHTDVVDDERNAIELAHVVGQNLMLAAGIDHHRHPIFACRGQHTPVAAFSHDLEIQTRGDAQAQAARGFTYLSD